MADYSKWNNIEISDDDEDDSDSSFDTETLFIMRHQELIERLEKHQVEKEELVKSKQSNEQKIEITQKKLVEINGNISEVQRLLNQLKLETKYIDQQEKAMNKKEKLTPSNVDTISKPGYSGTVVNKKPEKKEKTLSVEELKRWLRLNVFVKENEKALKKFGLLREYNDSREFLSEHPQLVCDDTSSYLAGWCMSLQLEKQPDLLRDVAHQAVCIERILDFAKHFKVYPAACAVTFFSNIINFGANTKDMKEFIYDEVEALIERVQKMTAELVGQVIGDLEVLDPIEVFESLPLSLKVCFELKDIGLLKSTLARMPAEKAKYYMNLFEDSGLLKRRRKNKAGKS